MSTVHGNKDIPLWAMTLLDSEFPVREFYIVGDMLTESKYGECVFAANRESFAVVDGTISVYRIADVREMTVKRMYGNACLYCEFSDGKKVKLLRFTYAVASLFEAAAHYITAIAGGADVDEELGVIEATYERLMSVCPKCGRALLRPGAECIQCQSKAKIAGKLMKYVKPHKTTLIICLVLSCITTAMALLPPSLTSKLIDDVIPNADKSMLYGIVWLLLISYVLQYAIGGFRNYMLRCSGDRIVQALRNDVYAKAQKLPMRFYDRTSTGSVINRISGDTATIQAFMLRISQEVVVQAFLLVGIMIIMLTSNWRLTLMSLLPVPIVVVGAKIFGRKIAPFYRRIWRRWAAVSSVLTDTIPCVRIVKSFAGEKRAVERFERQNEEWYKVDVRSAKITNAFPAIVSFVVTCGSLLIWGVGGSWVIDLTDPSFQLGDLVAFISYTSMFYGPVNFFAYLSDSYQGALAAAERVLDILDAEAEPDFGKGKTPEKISGAIEFCNVSFSFDRTKKTLSDINLKIEPGDIVGIVGTTGSGKSTLINLLMRFYDNYEGTILIDGTDIREIDIGYYRSQIGYVQQEPMMFSDTIFNNIAYGVPGAHIEAVIHAAEVANAHEFIANQPDGYDSMLGERGVGISGGEKQRLSIARAVLKNPSILVFDEATASVDSETESLIQEAIDRLISGRTTLMIAHRLSTLRKANKIVVVDKGRIVECGTREELMALKGRFYKLIKIQSLADSDNIELS